MRRQRDILIQGENEMFFLTIPFTTDYFGTEIQPLGAFLYPVHIKL